MSIEPLPERWQSRDLPVLLAIAKYLDSDENPPVAVSDITETTGFSDRDVIRACQALHPGYIEGRPLASLAGVDEFLVTALTERGRRTTGLWPDGDTAVEQLLDALGRAADVTEDPDEKTALRRAGGQLATVSRSVVAEVIAAVVAKQTGLG